MRSSVDGAIEDLLWGALLASLVVFAFFGDLRSTIVTIAGLPVIMISTLFFMNLMGIGLNNISLLALALVVGLVIDDAIVVRENILRWVHMGTPPREAASVGTAEVFLPVLATTATVMAVFLPVAFAEGIIGRFFVAFGLTVAIAMAISFFESLTMAPMLSAYFIGKPKKKKQDAKVKKEAHYEEGEAMNWLDRFYGRTLRVVLRMKWVTLLLTILIFAGSVYAATFLTFSFVPTIDQHQFTMQVKLPAGTPLAASQAEATRIEAILRQHPSVTDILTTVGSTGAPENLSFFVKLQDKTDSRAVMNEMRQAFSQAPGLTFSQAAGLTGATSDVVVEVRGLSSTKYADLGAEAAKVMEQVKTVPGLADLNTTFTSGRPEVRFVVDRQKAAELGLSTAQIGSTIRTLVNGQVVTTYRGDDDEADIRVLLDDRSGAGVDEILNLSLLTPTGKLIPLRQVAKPEEAAGPGQILRVDKQPTIRINANIAGRPVPAGVGEVTAMVEKMAAAERHACPDGRYDQAAGRGLPQPRHGDAALRPLHLHGAGVAVQQLHPAAADHARPAARHRRRAAGARRHRPRPRHDGLHRLYHVDGSRHQELDSAGGLCQPRARQGPQRPGGDAARRPHPPAPDPHDLALDDPGHDPARARPQRRRRVPPGHVDRHHGRSHHQHAADAADRPRRLRARRGLAGPLE